MSEVEQVCDRVAIVDKGHIIAMGTLDDLRGYAKAVRVRATNVNSSALGAISDLGEVHVEEGGIVVRGVDDEAVPALVQRLVGAGARIYSVQPAGSLKRAFSVFWRPRIMPLLTIANLTLREASRRKLLLAVGIITLVVIPLVAWGFSRIRHLHCHGTDCGAGTYRGAEAVILVCVNYMFAFVITVAAPFLAAPAIASDVSLSSDPGYPASARAPQ